MDRSVGIFVGALVSSAATVVVLGGVIKEATGLNLDPNWTLASLTLVLVAATIWYAYEARAARAQLKQEHDFALQPSVIVQKWRGAAIEIANLGRGPGLNIKVRLSFFKEDGSFVLLKGRHPGLAPGEHSLLTLQVVPRANSLVSADQYGGPGIARVELQAQNVVTGKYQRSTDPALRPDYNWRGLASLPE